MKVYTVLCITRDLDNPQIIVSNYVKLEHAEKHFAAYKEEDGEKYRLVSQDLGDFEALNDVIDHFTALDEITEEKVEEVFLIKTEEVPE